MLFQLDVSDFCPHYETMDNLHWFFVLFCFVCLFVICCSQDKLKIMGPFSILFLIIMVINFKLLITVFIITQLLLRNASILWLVGRCRAKGNFLANISF